MNAFFKTPALRALASGLLCLTLGGCDTAPTWVDRHFGQAVQQQTHTASAPHETDGVSAKAAVDRYHDSLQAPAAAPSVFNFNLGAGPAH
jgi:hypothetical protein